MWFSLVTGVGINLSPFEIVRFERTYVGVVFYIKISAGNHYVYAGGRLKNSKNSTFLETPSGKHGLKDWFRVTEFSAMAIKTL